MKKIILNCFLIALVFVSFTACSKDEDPKDDSVNVNKPSVSTKLVYDITKTEAECGGEILNVGASPITECGFCWSTSPNADTTDNRLSEDGSAIYYNLFSGDLAGLSKGTTYYLRAYAVNSFGISYGNEISFNTLSVSYKASGTISFTCDGNDYSFPIDTLKTEYNGFSLEAASANILNGTIAISVYADKAISISTTYNSENGGIITLYLTCFYQAALAQLRPGSSLTINLSEYAPDSSVKGTFSGTTVLYMGSCASTKVITNGVINCVLTEQ